VNEKRKGGTFQVKKFIIMAVSLLLTALLALAGCMYAIGENKAESKPYDMGETVSVAPEDTPEAQKESVRLLSARDSFY
jgi:hypothetical protein